MIAIRSMFRVWAGAVSATAVLASPAGAQSLDGLWQSDGYGYYFRVAGDQLKAFEITAVSCLPSFTATRVTRSQDRAEAVFELSERGGTLQIIAGESPDVKQLHSPGAASSIIAHRIDREPASCSRPTANNPKSNFAVFWHTYAEQYGFFDLKRVDWTSVRGRYESRVASSTKPNDLLRIFKEMINPLEDAHTSINAPGEGRFHGWRQATHRLTAAERTQALDIITKKYLRGRLRSWCNDRVAFGKLPDDIGYLRISAYSGYTTAGDYESGAVALEAALDTALSEAAAMRGLVIDVRINDGGADPYGLAVASRLTSAEYLAYTKEARADPVNPSRWTPGQPSTVRPSHRPHFLGNVVLLTGSNTVSAGETFTMALMGRMPAVTRIGENTQGVFSDVLGRTLPNGWRFGLPNERFLTREGIAFDGPGIPPNVVVPVFTEADLSAGHDPALDRALEVLRR